jgi:hypothetical protein
MLFSLPRESWAVLHPTFNDNTINQRNKPLYYHVYILTVQQRITFPIRKATFHFEAKYETMTEVRYEKGHI